MPNPIGAKEAAIGGGCGSGALDAPADLNRACLLADALGRISRALNYARLLPGLDEPARAEYMPNVAGWLQEFLASPVLR